MHPGLFSLASVYLMRHSWLWSGSDQASSEDAAEDLDENPDYQDGPDDDADNDSYTHFHDSSSSGA
jgi:hypothetical protein